MKKQTVKDAGGLCLCWIGLMAAVCVPSFIAGAMYKNPCEPAEPVTASASGTENNIPSPAGEANPQASGVQAEQPGLSQAVQTHATAGGPCPEFCGPDANGTSASGHATVLDRTVRPTHRRAIGSGLEHVDVIACNK